ncbi:MAG TPA: sulfatase-like hydrolase/transferase, partial [Flavisolibacter sp.]
TIPSEDLDEFRKVNVHEDTLKKYGYISIEELNAFRYTDFGYRKFMEAARKRPYFRNTVFVFVGDHGIRGDAGSMFPKAWTEQALTTVHVPLLFYAPGLLEPSRNSSVCSQMDILPSLAGLLSMPYRNTGLGRDLFDTTLHRNPFRFSSAFIVDPDEKKIGVVSDSFYLRKHVGRQDYEFVSLFHNDALPPGPRYDSLKYVLGLYSEAFYETARYMLYNNKKPKKTGQPATGTVRR